MAVVSNSNVSGSSSGDGPADARDDAFNGESPIVCVVGPTASGKSSLAIRVAQAIGADIVSADSMQIYRGMDIGTGKVAPDARCVAHYGLDIVDPGEPFSAALFQQYARGCFKRIAEAGRRAILCGGTGFYVRAAIDDYEFPEGEQVGNPVRDQYNALASEAGPHAVWEALNELDAQSAAIIPQNDVKRIVRALELHAQGESYARQKEKLASIAQRYPAVFIGLAVDPDILRRRIDARVDAMFEGGLVDEVKGLIAAGFREGVTAPQAIGYKEIVAALDGQITLDEACEQIKIATHRYAKRQRTWFRKDRRIAWLDANEFEIDRLTREALDLIAGASGAERG